METYAIFSFIVFCKLTGKTDSFKFLAFKRPVTVSSRYNSEHFSPSNAVDGDRSTDLLKCTLTGFDQKEAWLRVDLGSKKNIESISILHGGLGDDASPIESTILGVRPDSDGTGTVYLRGNGNVYLRGNGTICGDNFNTGDAMVICLIWGFIPDYPSYKKVNTSSNIVLNDPNCSGNEVRLNECPMGENNCTSGQSVSVKCREGSTLAGFSVYISDTEDWKSGHVCHHHEIEEIPRNTISFPCVFSGRYVTVYNSRNATQFPSVSDWAYINICELNVAGCDFGSYGGECSRCPEKCLNNNCHIQTGACSACKEGYTGHTCTECEYGYFGLGCNNSCSIANCKNSSSCDAINGACLVGCVDGWTGSTCNVGLGASSLRTSDSGLFPYSNGDGTVFASPLSRICNDSFDEKDAKVVCLAWEFLTDYPLYNTAVDSSSTYFYENVLNYAGNEVNINKCSKGSSGCPSRSAVAVTCKSKARAME
ncbi:scavenger receptor cysteine-rich domain superfamily protein-like [Saccostrea cucullata]|uniref:scavenger receptor cysteine-rich domain superfamily protein-like n=1 Tax=Saccostrea cuccullata TaxID=36930 RepID=UPI002ED23FC5